MKRTIITGLVLGSLALSASAQTTYDSTTLVDTNNNSTSTSTVNTNNTNTNTSTSTSASTIDSTSVNTNNNINTSTSTSTNTNINQTTVSGTTTVNNVNSGTMTYNNNNVNSGTMTYNNNNNTTSNNVNTNHNINSGTQTFNNNNNTTSNNTNTNINTSTSTNTNHNINSGTQTFNNNNVSTSTATNNNNNVNTSTSSNNNVNQNIQSGEMTNRNINDTTMRVIQPPPTAIAPAMMSGGNNDLCTTGTSGAVQTQILGVSSGGTVRDYNCERLKNAKTLFDMGMKVAAVSVLCQDRRVFDAMWNAGTPCPYEGMIGEQAKVAWNENPNKIPKPEEPKGDDFYKKTGFGALLGGLLYSIFIK